MCRDSSYETPALWRTCAGMWPSCTCTMNMLLPSSKQQENKCVQTHGGKQRVPPQPELVRHTNKVRVSQRWISLALVFVPLDEKPICPCEKLTKLLKNEYFDIIQQMDFICCLFVVIRIRSLVVHTDKWTWMKLYIFIAYTGNCWWFPSLLGQRYTSLSTIQVDEVALNALVWSLINLTDGLQFLLNDSLFFSLLN